jgi:murein DD-endopeptidase MepM/ murein hydrolase activator NlpD
MEQIRYQGYARDRGFNPVQLSTASVDAIGQQGSSMLRQMRENQSAERETRNAFLSGMQNSQQLEQQNRSDNFAFAQRSRQRFQEAMQQRTGQAVEDARLAAANLDKQVTALSVLAPLSGTIAKTVVEWKKQKDEDDKAQGYADWIANGPDQEAIAKAEAGLADLKKSDELIQTTADQLQDAGAAPEAVRSVKKLSKMYLVGRAMAIADMAVPMYPQYLEDQYQNNDQLQVQFRNPDTGQLEVITPKTHMGPDQRAAVNKVLFKQFIKEQGLLDINPALISKSLLAMRQAEMKLLDQERTAFEKAENENALAEANFKLDAGLNTDPVTAIKDALNSYRHLRNPTTGERFSPLGSFTAVLDYLVKTGNKAAVDAFSESESYMQGVPWGVARRAEFTEAFRKLDSQQASDEDLQDRIEAQGQENWTDDILNEFNNSPNGVDQAFVDQAIEKSRQLYNGKVDQRLLQYRENSTLQARTAAEQKAHLEELYAKDQLTVAELRSGKYSPDIVGAFLTRAKEQDKQRTTELAPVKEQYGKGIKDALLQAIKWTGGAKNPSYAFAEAHALAQLDQRARVYMQSGGSNMSPQVAYSKAAQDIITEIKQDNSDPSKPYGTYSVNPGDQEFYRWGAGGSGGQGGMSAARSRVSGIISQVSSGGQAAVTQRRLITEPEARALVNPDAPIPDSIRVIQNALPRGKEMSEFEIIDAQLQQFGLPPRQRPYVQRVVESSMSPRLQELLNRTPTAARTSRALTGAGLVGPGQERQAIQYIASNLGVDPVDVATFINYETAGSLVSGSYRRGLDIMGGDGGNYLGWIQFSPYNQQKYGVQKGMNAMQMADAVTRYLKDAGIRPGDSLEMLYQAVQAPAYLGRARAQGRVIGADSNGTLTQHIKNMRSQHRNRAGAWLMDGAVSGGTTSAWRDTRLMSAPAQRLLSQLPKTSSFMQQESFRRKPHEGNDYGAATGTKLSFKQAGTVLQVGSPTQDNGGYGGFVDIRLQDGNVVRIAHLSKVKVQPGQRIGAKQVAALSGNTGRSSGPHIHIEHLSGPSGTQETTRGKRDPSWIASQIYADI